MTALVEVYPLEVQRIRGLFAIALTLTDVTMQDAIEVLRSQGIPICFEQVPLVPERATRRANGRINYGRTHFDVVIPEGSVSAALNALTTADPDYQWEQVGERAYTVYPLPSALEWHVPRHDQRDQRDQRGGVWIDQITQLGLCEHGISLFSRGLSRQPRVKLDFVPSESVARRWLTAVVDYVNQGRYWTLAGFLGGRSLVIGQVAPQSSKPLDHKGAYLTSPHQPY